MSQTTKENPSKQSKRFLKTLEFPVGKLSFYSLKLVDKEYGNVTKLPYSIRILLENIIRNYNGFSINDEHIKTILNWKPKPELKDIPFLPARVLMQDFTGVPSVVDIASIRSEVLRKGKQAEKINPEIPVDLIIDHSVQADYYGTNYAFEKNVEIEYQRNEERYSLLKWANLSLKNFKVLPPGMGICHQVNLEYLATVVTKKNGFAFPDTLVGTDSHTPMVNGIGVVGWGVGGIEAEAAMLGQPIYFMLPEVIGLKLTGALKEGITSTDLVLTIAELLRKQGVVGKFVEVFGTGLNNLTVPDRATISNMSPEFGCTITYFPPDEKTLEYLQITGRTKKHIDTVEKYLKANLLWRENEDAISYTKILELNLSEIKPCIAGPKRPQDKILLDNVKNKFIEILKSSFEREYVGLDKRAEDNWQNEGGGLSEPKDYSVQKNLESYEIEIAPQNKVKNGLKSVSIKVNSDEFLLSDGSIVIAAITSCTNTSNPSVMLGAGLLAKKAVEKGLKTKTWVKTSLAPGSKVVTEYFEKANLTPFLDALGFHLVGYGCTTCIGNSGQLPTHISKAVTENNLVVASILSGNRNFEARIHPLVKMNYLSSPMLVVAYAIAGRIDIDFTNEPVGFDPNLNPVYLNEILPTNDEINYVMNKVLDAKDFRNNYKRIFQGDDRWNLLKADQSEIYHWEDSSTYIKEAPFFKDISIIEGKNKNILSARVLLKLGDSITTDHISPAGSIAEDSAAGKYLKENGVEKINFNSYGSRRGNHEVMIRGTFANVRLKNQLVNKEGSWAIYHPTGEIMTVFDAAMKYKNDNIPLIILAGKEYGSGSSRDWAAKGTALLGVKAILAESFERIHRSNLVGMGVLPLRFNDGENYASLGLLGDEVFDISDIEENLSPNKKVNVIAKKRDGNKVEFKVTVRLDSPIEIEYYKNGGILQYVLKNFLKNN